MIQTDYVSKLRKAQSIQSIIIELEFLIRVLFLKHDYIGVETTCGRAVLPSKLVDGRTRVQSPIALVDLAVRSITWSYSPKLA